MIDAPYDYAEFTLRAAGARARVVGRQRRAAALACGALVLVGSAAWIARTPGTHALLHGLSEPVLVGAQAAAQADFTAHPDSLAPEQASALLAALPESPAIVRVGTGIATARLEDRIALLDDQLSDAQLGGDTLSSIHGLHVQRAQMIDSLTRVRYAEQLAAIVR